MKIAEARKRLGEYAKSPASERVEAYREIMKRIKPVMRHFFMEKHYVPERWFEMRLSYSRSVAVTSMIGHVLGLGDRHVSNIMIDTAKGELVPIDLGIAFEAVSVMSQSLYQSLLSSRAGNCRHRSSCPSV